MPKGKSEEGPESPVWKKLHDMESKIANLEVLVGQLVRILITEQEDEAEYERQESQRIEEEEAARNGFTEGVKEVDAAPRCPECRGTGIGSTFYNGNISPCSECNGKGTRGV